MRLDALMRSDDTALAVGSGSLPVLGTPRLLAWCEAATCAAIITWSRPAVVNARGPSVALAKQQRPSCCMAGLHSRMGTPDYAELHCLSDFSFGRGASSAAELFDRAKQQGYRALAIARGKLPSRS